MSMGDLGRKVRFGVIGLGGRGQGQLDCILQMEDVDIAAVCDIYPDRAQAGADMVEKARGYRPDVTLDDREVTSRKDIEGVFIFSNWETHIRIAIDAIKNGIRPAMEVGGANSVEECWALVHESEKHNVPVMLLENCCYNKEEMTLLRMIRQGLFGELVHIQGGYEHDLREEIGNGDIIRHYRLRHFLNRNAELYPTHELGPIAKYLGLNRGNRMLSLVSVSSKAAGLSAWFKEHRPDSPYVNARVNEGDIVNTIITCANGETILLTHDCTLPRPYSRGGRIQGTKGIWMEDNRSIFLEGMSPVNPEAWTHEWEKDAKYMEKYEHPLWKEYEAFGLRGGHGGMDYLVLRAYVESVQNRTLPPIDVYDTAAWMCITALSEESIARGSVSVTVPDFTNGRWYCRTDKAEGMYSLEE